MSDLTPTGSAPVTVRGLWTSVEQALFGVTGRCIRI